MSILAQLTANQLSTAQHVAPLIVAAELHVAAVFLEQHIEVVALHNHVVELQEAQSLFHTLLVALCSQHVVYGKACAYLAKQLYIIQLQQPVCIVYHQGLVIAEINKFAHLYLEAVTVVLNHLRSHHLTHIGTSGRISDHSCSAANQGDGLISCHLQTLHQAKSHEMTNMQTVCSRIETNVESCLSFIYHFFDFFFICNLGNQTAGYQLVITSHVCFLSFFSYLYCSFGTGIFFSPVS